MKKDNYDNDIMCLMAYSRLRSGAEAALECLRSGETERAAELLSSALQQSREAYDDSVEKYLHLFG